ncbi:MAG TPA: hypothetical protein VJI71_00405 [Candidatus Norongarragalinales archaeon]|nr:hypothetical protein [Candidatus Micrarchaeota archaeon]HLC37897.1 hypothetical protein [Candidatus Norongarragalinales archaeon]
MAEHEKDENVQSLVYVAIAVLVMILAFNQYQLATVSSQISLYSAPRLSSPQGSGVASQASNINLQALADRVIPTGVPAVYGTELGVSYDDPVGSLTVLGLLDGDLNPGGKLKFSQLNAQAQQRYVAMGQMIACEYCCGANALVFPNGQPACGCQHSAAMRGLAMYLLINHPDMTDVQILAEMGKWKTLFFPKQVLSKAISFASAGLDSNINTIDLTSEKFRDFKASAISTSSGSPASSGSIDTSGWSEDEKMNYEMHGIIPARVQQSTSSGSAGGVLANAPDMVGGC